MAVITLPTTPNFSTSTFGLRFNTRALTSPFTQDVQTLEQTGARWFASYQLPAMTRARAAPWQAFLAQLRGRANRFGGFDPDAKSPRGSALGTPLVRGASQTGTSLLTDGWDAIETNLLLPGDYFSVNGELKMVVAALNSDSGGEATIVFEPSLRTAPADNAALTLNSPTCTMMLTGDEQATWDTDFFPRYQINFSAVEVFT